ncbi:MAG: diphthine--ammonia ligase [Chlamydiales bacterium]|nr:diphthine--ammonia ligase [Chlamydiales bacterium]
MNAAVLWTGGKDCCLAMHEAINQGFHINLLVTFVPIEGDFEAHPLSVMKQQAEAMGLHHLEIPIEPPYKENYTSAIRLLERQVEWLITGDIDLVDGLPNWIRECCEETQMNVLTPLWQQPRRLLLDKLLSYQIEAHISYIKSPYIDCTWINRKIDRQCIEDLEELNEKYGVDPCGENGEYHSIVVNSPLFRNKLAALFNKRNC